MTDQEVKENNDLANETADAYNAAYHNLSGAVLTASSAYMAIATAVIGPSGAQEMLTCQRNLIGISVVFFLTSIICSISTLMRDVYIFKTMHTIYRNRAKNKTAKNESQSSKYESINNSKCDTILIIIQVTCFALGTLATILLIFTYLNFPLRPDTPLINEIYIIQPSLT
ncbi:hypothetical protein IJJ36_01585 [Candidatus Saccharibacteria bacterium]|nr:hypothetical protein [Candidatus Saccharibacteria bacterium]MBQ6461107.1 hypothetical protein [Candidatus Saccharibacteria bacterium]